MIKSKKRDQDQYSLALPNATTIPSQLS